MWAPGFQARAAEPGSAITAMTYYERNLPHVQRDLRPHFLTFATYKRISLAPWSRDIVLSACHFHNEKSCDLGAAVIMPDHVHLILVPLVDEEKQCVTPIHWITRSIKGFSARQINARIGRKGTVWQDESFDHVIRRGDWDAKLEYLLLNPVRKGLAERWQDYRWCWWKGIVNPWAPEEAS
jgi:REP element-mobilizing transposase RayT